VVPRTTHSFAPPPSPTRQTFQAIDAISGLLVSLGISNIDPENSDPTLDLHPLSPDEQLIVKFLDNFIDVLAYHSCPPPSSWRRPKVNETISSPARIPFRFGRPASRDSVGNKQGFTACIDGFLSRTLLYTPEDFIAIYEVKAKRRAELSTTPVWLQESAEIAAYLYHIHIRKGQQKYEISSSNMPLDSDPLLIL
jgi:hypothetical protein